MLSAAKHLTADRERPFPFTAFRASAHSLRVTRCDSSNGQEHFVHLEPCLNIVDLPLLPL